MRSRALLGCALVAAAAFVAAPAARAYDAAAVRSDADWIIGAQLNDGSLATYPDKQYVSPYLSNFASLGLTRAAQVTGDRRYSDAAWRWLSWYAAHEDGSGYVSDYVVVNGTVVPTGDMDSTDAYAATFLLAARDAWRVTHDSLRLRTLWRGVSRAVGAIQSTQDGDGLTWAKPSWHVKYLMDEAEVYAGLRAAVELAQSAGDFFLASSADSASARVRRGVQGLWNSGTGAYDWAVHSDGGRQATDWTTLYPDALEEAWAVAFGVADATRAAPLMQRFAAAQPGWASPSATAKYASGPAPVGYWPAAGWAFARLGDSATAASATESIRSAALASRRAWPFTTANAGQLIVLGTGGPTS